MSCKITRALALYADRQGIPLAPVFELFEGPEEFLKDPYFWIDTSLCEKILLAAGKLMSDPSLGGTLAQALPELGALGALDQVFKMMPSKKDYYENLKRFFTYFLAPLENFREKEHGEDFVRFEFPIPQREFRQVSMFLQGLLENLPKYTGHPSSQSHFEENGDFYLTWATQQSSLFSESPGRLINPKLVQNLSAQLEATERALQAKNREILTQRAELEQLRFDLQTQVREKIYTEKMSGLAQLAAGVAHEINNPLSFVFSNLGRFEDYFGKLKTYVDALEAGLRNPELKKKLDIEFIFSESPLMLKEAAEGLRRVKEIVKDLSGLAHPQASREEAKMLTDLNGILESSLKVFQDEIKATGIHVEKNYGLKAPVKVFPVRMSQVFMNLLSNAIHAVSQDGRIQLTTLEKAGDAVIEITDDGVGIDETHIPKIFTPFFTTKEVGRGTGLGLSIAQSIVEMHKGQIDVESRKGKGSRFIVSIPLTQ